MSAPLPTCSLWHCRCRTEDLDVSRRRVHEVCERLLDAHGGPAAPLPFETLVWLAEVTSSEQASTGSQAKEADGTVPAGSSTSELQAQPDTVGRLAAVTAHRFPTCGTAWAVLGLTLARRCLRHSKGDTAGKWAGDVAKAGPALAALMLEHGCAAGDGGTAAAWVVLTRLRLRGGDSEAALAAIAGGMAWVRHLH